MTLKSRWFANGGKPGIGVSCRVNRFAPAASVHSIAAAIAENKAVTIADVASNHFSRRSVVSVRGEVAVLNHQHPTLAITDQAKAKGFSERVA